VETVGRILGVLRTKQAALVLIIIGTLLLFLQVSRSTGSAFIVIGGIQGLYSTCASRMPQKLRPVIDLIDVVFLAVALALGIATLIYAKVLTQNTF